jgi:hypothetical protein
MLASSILTFVGLVVLGAVVAGAYVFLVARRTAPGDRPKPVVVRPGRLSLRAVVESLASVGDDETTFVDRSTGGLVTLGDELAANLGADEPLDEALDFSEAELEQLRRKLRAKLLLPLPTKAQTKEFQLQERFCAGLGEGPAQEQMLKVMRGQTGFRSFDGAVERLGIAEQWQQYRDTGFAGVAIAWLQRNKLPFDHDLNVLAA